MFYKIIDENTKQVDVGLGNNNTFYKSIGMKDGECEKSYNGNWYLKGYAPQKPLEELRQEKIQQLKSNCSEYIYSKYPVYKQLNVANGLATQEEIAEMTTFIQKTRLVYKDKKDLIEKAENMEEIEAIGINFSEEEDNNNN